MTNAMTTTAAYEAWLGIPASQHPPHHYALLGLQPFTSNEQTIFHAYQQRATLIGPHLAGPQADVARRLLGELAAAQACLLNGEARASYDRRLGERLQPPSPLSSSAGGTRPAPRSKEAPPGGAEFATDEIAVKPPPYPFAEDEDEDQPASVLPWLVGGICAGLLAVAVLGVALFGYRRSPESFVAVPSSTKRPSHAQEREQRNIKDDHRFEQRDRDAGMGAQRDGDDVLGQRIAPLTTVPEHLRLDIGIVGPPSTSSAGGDTVALVASDDDESPASSGTPDPPAKPETGSSTPELVASESTPASVLAKLPRSFALPSRTAGEAHSVLTQLPVKNAEDVSLKLDTTGVAGLNQFRLLKAAAGLAPGERIWPIAHTSADGTTRPVGEYALVGDELSFHWADGAQASDEALANAALSITIDDQVVQINQRTPDIAAPLKLAVDAGAVTTSAKIEDRPADAKLYFALDRQNETFPAHQLQPAEPAAAGKEIDVVFGEATDPYRLSMRVSLVENGAGGVRIEARPMLQAGGDGHKWEYFRPKAVLQTLAQFKQQESLLDGQLAQLRQRFGRNSLQLQQATANYNRQAADLQTRILALENMHVLCQELNDHGALHYRVFAKLSQREVELLDSSLGITVPMADAPAAAPPDKDDPSAIVGPPTAARASTPPPVDDAADANGGE